MADYGNSSRFYNTQLVAQNNIETLGLWQRPNFLTKGFLNIQDIMSLKITQPLAGRPDQIARQLYGDTNLDWVIIMFNNPLNPLGWPVVGTIISAPTKTAVMRYM